MKVSKFVRFGAVLAMAFAVTAMTATNASAAAMLRITDVGSATTITITDQQAGLDVNAAVGAVTWIGTIGVWNLNVSTGVSKPIMLIDPHMDLNSVNNSTGAGTLILEFTDIDWMGLGSVSMPIGGTSAGTVTYSAYYDAGNAAFGKTTLIDSIGPFGPGAFSGTGSGPLGLTAPYSLTQVVTIVHTGRGVTSFDAELVPEPASLALLGLGLFGAAMSARRRNRA